MEQILKWLQDNNWLIVTEEVSKDTPKRTVSITAVSPEGTLRVFKENPKGGIIVG